MTIGSGANTDGRRHQHHDHVNDHRRRIPASVTGAVAPPHRQERAGRVQVPTRRKAVPSDHAAMATAFTIFRVPEPHGGQVTVLEGLWSADYVARPTGHGLHRGLRRAVRGRAAHCRARTIASAHATTCRRAAMKHSKPWLRIHVSRAPRRCNALPKPMIKHQPPHLRERWWAAETVLP